MAQDICPVDQVRVRIPRKRLIRLFYERRMITNKESAFLGQKKKEIEENILSLQHALSIVDVIRLRTYDKT
jgi:hypothetical protein